MRIDPPDETRALQFVHRSGDTSPLIDRVWRTRSSDHSEMTSAARTNIHLVVSRDEHGLAAGFRGPETLSFAAPVPPDTEYLGIRFTLGTVIASISTPSIVDRYLPLPITSGGRIVIGGDDFEAPRFDTAEQFVDALMRSGTVIAAQPEPDFGSRRTAQRQHRAVTGLTRSMVAQIDRANKAAMLLREGLSWSSTIDRLGYYDQAHLGRALRRFVGVTPGELASGSAALSFLYKADESVSR